MPKKHYILATVSFLLIPAVTVLGGMLFSSIDPEIAVRYPDYERNYRILDLAKHLSIGAAFLVNMLLWFMTCFFLVKSKQRSYGWVLLGLLGPFGLIALTLLGDKAPAPGDLYRRFVGRLGMFLRATLELCLFAAVWVAAYQAMVLKRDLQIIYEAATTGVSTAQIIELQNASSGMWAFGEGLEVLYLVALFYLLWPVLFNAAGRMTRSWGSTDLR